MKLLVADEVADRYIEELSDLLGSGEVAVARSASELESLLHDFAPSIAYSCVSHRFPRHCHSVIASLPSLEWLHVGGSGFDHMAAIDKSRTRLTNGRGVLAPFQADTVIGALIALNHGLLAHHREQATGSFRARTHPSLVGQTLLVVGPGAIGREVAKRAKAFGIRCVAISRRPTPHPEFDDVFAYDHLDDLLAEADILSLHLPLTPDTRGLIGADRLARMKPSAILINTARGGIVDEAALGVALEQNRLRGAYLDVFAQEPLPADSPLRNLPNLLITPHCADQIAGWQEQHARFFMSILRRWLKGEPLTNEIR